VLCTGTAVVRQTAEYVVRILKISRLPSLSGSQLDRYAIVMVDMQLERSTKAAPPSLHFPGEQG